MPKHTLTFAVRPTVVLKYLGQLFLVLACLTVVPYFTSIYFGDFRISFRYGIVLAGLVVAGLSLRRFQQPGHIQTNEAMVLVALMFLITPVIMAYPMNASGMSYEDALFEAISAATTTGLSTLETVQDRPATFLFARAWMQWYGGLGILIFALASMIQPGRLTKGLAVAENNEDDFVGGTRAHAKYVLIAYGALTGSGIALLLACGVGAFDSTVYTFAAVSTGGVSPHNSGLAGLSPGISRVVVISLCLAGSLSFVFYRQVYWKGWRIVVSDMQTRAVFLACLVTSVALGLSMWGSGTEPLELVVRRAPIVGFSAQTTTGFTTVKISEFSASSKLILILSMMVGGGVGSTAGGVKVLRLLIAFRLISLVVERTGMPVHAWVTPRLGGQKLEPDEIQQTLCLILLFIALITFSWLPFVAAGYDPLDSLFEVVSATATVGLSTGLTAPELPSVLKRILAVDMLMGRLEIMAWLVLVYPRTWFGQRRDLSEGYPRRRS